MENKNNTRLFIALSTIVVLTAQVRDCKLVVESLDFVRAMLAAMLWENVPVFHSVNRKVTQQATIQVDRYWGKCACRAQFAYN
jgi:hypothetical protein